MKKTIKNIALLILFAVLLQPSFVLAADAQLTAPNQNTTPSPGANCIDRSCAFNEFNGNDAAINNLCGLAKVETGMGNPRCVQMFIESVMNRAAALSRPGTCSNTVQSRLNDTPYWGAGSKRSQNTPAEFQICLSALNGALSGSNLCNYCTDNASDQPGNPLRTNRLNAGNPGVDCEYAGGQVELFYTNINGSGSGGVPAHARWRREQEQLNSAQNCTPQNVSAQNGTQNVDQGSNPPSEQQSPGQQSPGQQGGGSTSSFNSTPPGQIALNNLSDALKFIWVATLQVMTSQLTAVMMEQVLAVGSFFDAKQQLETQRLYRQKHAQAHKDYHPSEQMCEIGTFSRNLANTEKRAELTKTAMAQSSLSRMLGTGNVTTGDEFDEKSKMIDYLDKFCSPNDNGNQNSAICNNTDQSRMNADINYTQTIGMPLTIPLNMLDDDTKPEEENLFALLDNLVMHDAFPWKSKNAINQLRFREPYQDMRSLIAMRSVVQNSFSHIISEKTESPESNEESNAPFLKALMREMGLNDEEIIETIGENPSYYAQMDVLTKKIYQHPEFIANLYDKPANVKRMKAALTAVKLMQDRDIHNAMQRREMLMSLLLEIQLRRDQQELLTQDIPSAINAAGNTPSTTPSTEGTGEGF